MEMFILRYESMVYCNAFKTIYPPNLLPVAADRISQSRYRKDEHNENKLVVVESNLYTP